MKLLATERGDCFSWLAAIFLHFLFFALRWNGECSVPDGGEPLGRGWSYRAWRGLSLCGPISGEASTGDDLFSILIRNAIIDYELSKVIAKHYNLCSQLPILKHPTSGSSAERSPRWRRWSSVVPTTSRRAAVLSEDQPIRGPAPACFLCPSPLHLAFLLLPLHQRIGLRVWQHLPCCAALLQLSAGERAHGSLRLAPSPDAYGARGQRPHGLHARAPPNDHLRIEAGLRTGWPQFAALPIVALLPQLPRTVRPFGTAIGQQLRGRSKGLDEAHSHGADGHSADERARTRPRDDCGSQVQPRAVVRHDARSAQDLAGRHGKGKENDSFSLSKVFVICS